MILTLELAKRLREHVYSSDDEDVFEWSSVWWSKHNVP